MSDSTNELYKKYRPKSFKEIIGQDNAVKTLRGMLKHHRIPHSLLFTGPSGCGKTTLARILRNKLKCSKYDFQEINNANCRGIDTIRDINSKIGLAPIGGQCKIWMFDECHKMTIDAQHALLKLLEDTPSHVYFFLATTEPQKLIRTIKNRCTKISVKGLSLVEVRTLLVFISRKIKKSLPKEVREKIAENCDESARRALVLLDKIIVHDDEQDMLDAVDIEIAEKESIEIARALMSSKTTWYNMAKILKTVDISEPETIRRGILGYAKSVMLSGNTATSSRAYLIMDAFHDNYYNSGAPGLVMSCFEVITGSE